ncbi:hypothetical protein ACFGVR_14105 [Mucilaginibacter sp. AW1-3]
MMIEITGYYQGKNLYVQNPFSPNGVGFCVIDVRVNGDVTTDEIGSSAFEINLNAFRFKPGDKVTVVIYHKDGCKPKILNPEVLSPKSTFETVQISVVPQGSGYQLKWETKNEQGKLLYIAEQFRWSKWVKVGEVNGTGLAAGNNYQVGVLLHSGNNKFRVKQVDYTGQPRVSKVAEIKSAAPVITFSPLKPTTEIVFSAETMYELFDQYGNIIKKGQAVKIDVTALANGGYFLNYDNTTGEFVKK